MQSHDPFQTRVDCASYFCFFLGIRWVITVVGVPNETILQSERVNGFG